MASVSRTMTRAASRNRWKRASWMRYVAQSRTSAGKLFKGTVSKQQMHEYVGGAQ